MIQKLFRFEVDQSIRIEELKADSFIALANGEDAFIVKLPSKEKRRLLEYFRRIGQPKRFAPKVFATTLILAMRQFRNVAAELLIDIEYPGYEILITGILKNYFPNTLVYFGVIGKKSPAHHAAYGAHIGKRKENMLVKCKDILEIIKK